MKKFFKREKSILIATIILFLLAASCISPKRNMLLQDKTNEITSSFENKKQATYKVQSGDHLYIRIYSVDPKTSKLFQTDFPALMNPTYLYLNSYVVDGEGYISFSFVDKLFVRGLTIEEVKSLVQKTLNEFFKETIVAVRLVNFQVAVLGEVNTPGNFTIDKDQINIFQAIGLAGGLKEYANAKKIKLVRQTLKGADLFTVDLTDKEFLQSENFYLMPNDIIYVQPMKAKAYLYTQFPYAVIISTAALGVSILTLMQVLK